MIRRGFYSARICSKHLCCNQASASPVLMQKGFVLEKREYHATAVKKDVTMVVVGAGAIVGAYALQHSYSAIKTIIANRPKMETTSEQNTTEIKDETQEAPSAKKAETKNKSDTTNANSSSWMNSWFTKSFYDGGFEPEMTRREASLILGVRESASVERIKDAHRKILLLNHPDRGGSPLLATKINEAKEILLKGRT